MKFCFYHRFNNAAISEMIGSVSSSRNKVESKYEFCAADSLQSRNA